MLNEKQQCADKTIQQLSSTWESTRTDKERLENEIRGQLQPKIADYENRISELVNELENNNTQLQDKGQLITVLQKKCQDLTKQHLDETSDLKKSYENILKQQLEMEK